MGKNVTKLRNNYVFLSTSITAPQDAHKRLVVQVTERLTASVFKEGVLTA